MFCSEKIYAKGENFFSRSFIILFEPSFLSYAIRYYIVYGQRKKDKKIP